MKSIFVLVFLLQTCLVISQNYEWKSPCYNQENDQYKNTIPPRYVVKRFPKKVSVEIRINKYKQGKELLVSDFYFKGKIENETDVLPINDSLGVKLSLARTERNGEKIYLYILAIYSKKKDDCWRSMSNFSCYSEFWTQEFPLNGGGVGNAGDKVYFSFVEGKIRID